MNKSDLTSYIDTLSACRLFTGIDEQNLPAMLTCLDGNHIHVKKGNPIFVEAIQLALSESSLPEQRR